MANTNINRSSGTKAFPALHPTSIPLASRPVSKAARDLQELRDRNKARRILAAQRKQQGGLSPVAATPQSAAVEAAFGSAHLPTVAQIAKRRTTVAEKTPSLDEYTANKYGGK